MNSIKKIKKIKKIKEYQEDQYIYMSYERASPGALAWPISGILAE